MNYNFELLPEYNRQIKIRKQDFFAFSKKALKNHTKGKVYHIVGEVKSSELPTGDENLSIGDELHPIKPLGSHNAILNKKSAYVSVGDDRYVVILKSRVPFLILFTTLLAGIVAGVLLLLSLLNNPSNDVQTLAPKHPLPEIDINIEAIVGDNTTPNTSVDEGGGAVSMIYTLEATIDISDKDIDILFKNPTKSTHDVALELYITQGGKRTLIAKSGRIPAGNMLRTMTLSLDSATISEGIYDGVYKVVYYDSKTGERMLVESDITDVKIAAQK